MSGSGIRQVVEADGRLFLLDGDHPWGTNLNVFDPDSGRSSERSWSPDFGLLDLIEFNGYLWVTSSSDHVLIRIHPTSGEQHRYPLPGKPGGLVVADDAVRVTLYQPGALIRLDTSSDLIESSPIVVDDWNRFPRRLLCTGPARRRGTNDHPSSRWTGSTMGLGRSSTLSYQARATWSAPAVTCKVRPRRRQQAADLEQALSQAGISGPYVLAAAVDGVHAALSLCRWA